LWEVKYYLNIVKLFTDLFIYLSMWNKAHRMHTFTLWTRYLAANPFYTYIVWKAFAAYSYTITWLVFFLFRRFSFIFYPSNKLLPIEPHPRIQPRRYLFTKNLPLISQVHYQKKVVQILQFLIIRIKANFILHKGSIPRTHSLPNLTN